jgi:hypothetical protein
VSTEELYNKVANRDGSRYMVARYLAFVGSRAGNHINRVTHHHHILPKARDFFPEYRDLVANPWNGVHLTPREHFIAHWMLARAFPKSSQARAFFHLTNVQGRRRSRDYEAARVSQVAMVITMTQDPVRNAKISATLTGRTKSREHIQKMVGHGVTAATREKIRTARLGSKHTEASREKMSQSRTGKTKRPNSPEATERMRQTKLAQKKRWYNDGTVSKMFTLPPDDTWVLGRLRWVP